MLIIPEEGSYWRFNLLAIDPGLNNTGIAIYEIDYRTKQILSINAYTVSTEKLPNMTGFAEDTYEERLIKLYKLKMAIMQSLSIYNPCIVAIEAPFYNRFRPMAYGALMEVMSIIHSTILEYNYGIIFKKIEPLLIKKIVGAGSTKGKIDVKDSVKRIPEIMSKLNCDIEQLSEHAIDAIAIGWSYLKLSGE